MKKTIVGYDETKRLLNKLRKLNESKQSFSVLKEENEVVGNQKDDVDSINDTDVKLLSSTDEKLELNDKHRNLISQTIDNFKQQVNQVPNLDPGFTIDDEQIRLDGMIRIENNEIRFVLIAGNQEGCYINGDMLKIDIHILPELEKLVKFQETFKSSMETMINERKSEI